MPTINRRPRLPVFKGRHDLPLHQILTPLQYKIATLVASTNPVRRNSEIAIIVGTTEQVIKNYLHHIYMRANLSGKDELAARVLREGIVYGEKTA